MSTRTSKAIGMIMVVALAGIGAIFIMESVQSARREGGGFEYALLSIAGIAAIAWMLFRGPVGKGIASLFDGGSEADGLMAARVAELEMRFAEFEQRSLTSGEVEQAYARITDVEERVDFTERLLAQRNLTEARDGS